MLRAAGRSTDKIAPTHSGTGNFLVRQQQIGRRHDTLPCGMTLLVFTFLAFLGSEVYFLDSSTRKPNRPISTNARSIPGSAKISGGKVTSKEAGCDTTTCPSKSLPSWIQNYVSWHKKVRNQFPGEKLFTATNAPRLLIRTCLGLCGGLNDRLGQLPWDLYLANATGRVLLIHWHRPVPLEDFLVPNELDWSVPKSVQGFFSQTDVRVRREDLHFVRSYKDMFEGFPSDHPDDDFWNHQLDASLERANSGDFSKIKVLRHRLLGHLNEDRLEERLRKLGETDMLHWTASFGNIFWMFFRPSTAVQRELDEVYRNLNLQAGQYSAVHCRVRHPKATAGTIYVKGKNDKYPADKTGLPWVGETRTFAIDVATHALTCAKSLLRDESERIYFFSDSNDLVQYMVDDLSNAKYVSRNSETFDKSPVEASALALTQATRVIARNSKEENAHIDRQKGRDPPAYFNTFVDLLIAVNARCVTYGVGFYAVFSTKISGTACKLLYQEEAWGRLDRKRMNTQICQLKETQ